MASALAHPLFRTSSLDQGMHSASSGIAEGDIAHYHGSNSDHRIPSPLPLPPGPIFLKDISRSSSASTQSSVNMLFQQPQYHTRTASLSAGRAEEYNRQHLQHHHQQQQQSRSTLPGLTTLASLATTREPQMRYVNHTTPHQTHGLTYGSRSFSMNVPLNMNMSYNPLPAVPTPSISGNNNIPVSEPKSSCSFSLPRQTNPHQGQVA